MYRIAIVEIDKGERIRCYSPGSLALHVDDHCVCQTERMLEYGLVCKLDQFDGELEDPQPAKVLRCATLQDKAKVTDNDLRSRMAVDACQAKVEKFELSMRLVRVRYSFDRRVLLVLFSSEGRVDFRSMVKELAGELHARIEMRQIGVRDEAGLIGGIGPCGRNQCCCTWLRNFESINVKMAKTQRLSLNPTAISGMCGRLKCCLRYEQDQYVECGKGMPRDGAKVECADGRGRVVDQNILCRCVKVRLEGDGTREYPVDDIRVMAPQNTRPYSPQGGSGSRQRK